MKGLRGLVKKKEFLQLDLPLTAHSGNSFLINSDKRHSNRNHKSALSRMMIVKIMKYILRSIMRFSYFLKKSIYRLLFKLTSNQKFFEKSKKYSYKLNKNDLYVQNTLNTILHKQEEIKQLLLEQTAIKGSNNDLLDKYLSLASNIDTISNGQQVVKQLLLEQTAIRSSINELFDKYLSSASTIDTILNEQQVVKQLLIQQTISKDILTDLLDKDLLTIPNMAEKLSSAKYGYYNLAYNTELAEEIYFEQIRFALYMLMFSGDSKSFDVYTKSLKQLLKKIHKRKSESYQFVIGNLLTSYQYYNFLSDFFDLMAEDLKESSYLPTVYIAYISYLLLENREAEANKILVNYISDYNESLVHFYLPVAHLAAQLGYYSDDIASADFLFRNMKKAAEDNALERYIENKKVAIVGNAPLTEEYGQVIDSYDIVIRFNTYDTSPKYQPYYGSKTNIWTFIEPGINCGTPDLEFCVLRLSPYLHSYTNKVERLSGLLKNGVTITSFSNELYKEIAEKYSLYTPSTGFMMIYLVKKVNPEFSITDCYGFTFVNKDAEIEDFSKHYHRQNPKGGHDFLREQEILLKLFDC